MIKFKLNIFLLYLLTFLVLITSLRNISSAYYVVVGLLIFYFILRNLNKLFYFKKEDLLFYLFFIFSFFVFFWSFQFSTIDDIIMAAPRLLLMPLMGFIFICELKKEKDFINMLRLIVISFSLGAFSLIYQLIFGDLSWTAESMMRGYYIRYTSILGSLTVFGSIVGYLFILIYKDDHFIKSNLLKIIMLLMIVFALALSLTKSGLGLLLAAILLIVLFSKSKKFLKIIISFFLFILLIFIISKFSDTFNSYINALLKLSFGNDYMLDKSIIVASDSPTLSFEQFFKRLTYWISSGFEYYGNDVFFFGVGLKGGAGIMGLSGISSHNSYGDLIFMGGPLYLMIFLFLYFTVLFSNIKNIHVGLNSTFLLLNILYLLNFLFISGSVYQPAISILFYISIAYLGTAKLNKNQK